MLFKEKFQIDYLIINFQTHNIILYYLSISKNLMLYKFLLILFIPKGIVIKYAFICNK